MSYIYLDQWVWIELARCYHEISPSYPKYVESCTKVIESSNFDRHIFPFSMWHIIETAKRQKKESKRKLYEFIFEVSKFNTIVPMTTILELEVRNAILKTMSVNPVDLKSAVFKKGYEGCMGSEMKIVSKDGSNKKPPTEVYEKMMSAVNDPKLMSNTLSMYDYKDIFSSSVWGNEKLAEDMENLRKSEYNQKDKQKKRDFSDARFFLNVIETHLSKGLSDLKIDIKKYFDKVINSKEKANEFIKLIPTGYVFHILNYEQNTNFSRPIDPNDFYDIWPISIAVPYCEIVVIEKQWANILKKHKIDNLYSTIITHKIEDLKDLL
jgi:hypothetical protein